MQLATSPPGRNWTKWKKITVVYAISLLFYIIAYFYYGKTEVHTEIAILIFPIILAYIALFWSLDEARKDTKEQIENMQKQTLKQISALKNSTKGQIEAFETQSQGIVSALQKVVGAIGKMSKDLQKQMKQEEEKLEHIQKQNEDRLRALEKEAQKDLEKKQRIAPRIFARIADEPFFLLFRHYRLYIYNAGGITKDMGFVYFFSNSYNTVKQTVSIGSLDRDQGFRSIDCGDVPALSSYTAIQVSVSLRDKEDRLYVGATTIDKTNTEWMPIPLQEKPGE